VKQLENLEFNLRLLQNLDNLEFDLRLLKNLDKREFSPRLLQNLDTQGREKETFFNPDRLRVAVGPNQSPSHKWILGTETIGLTLLAV